MPKRVLIVEDDADTRHMLADILSARGYEVDLALDGGQALAKLQGPPPDLVTLDINMPIAGGGVVLDRVRSTAGWTRVPVLILSGSAEASDWARSHNAAGFLPKPFTLDALTRAVERLVPHQESILPKRS